jgi:hypothetical protein
VGNPHHHVDGRWGQVAVGALLQPKLKFPCKVPPRGAVEAVAADAYSAYSHRARSCS